MKFWFRNKYDARGFASASQTVALRFGRWWLVIT